MSSFLKSPGSVQKSSNHSKYNTRTVETGLFILTPGFSNLTVFSY